MARASLILRCLNDFALKAYAGSKYTAVKLGLAAATGRSVLVSPLGNCYPDHLFHCARRLLHRIALHVDGMDRPCLRRHWRRRDDNTGAEACAGSRAEAAVPAKMTTP
jgi:hypothetical protein